ncbi:MAG: TonB-dependent receptor, partial [Rikenellaceae bacterium]|nr:TonB-dependent receptor [Rikenellaceae bacterium]
MGNPDSRPSGRVTMNGYVYDALTGEPVAGVILQIEGTYTTVSTDAYGYYTLHLSPGEYTILILGAGQEDSRRHVKLYSEGRFDILSTEKIHTFREITVYGDRRDNVRQTVIGVKRLQMQNIKNVPTVFGEADIMRIVAMLPGVKTAGEISSGFNVRGGATDQNLILYNGGTIYNPNHLFGMFSAFNPDIVRDMELFKSSIPSKYSGRISSVLDINSWEGNKKEFQGSASIGLLTSRLTVEGPILKDKTSFILGGRTTYSDWLIKQIPEKSGFRDGSANFFDLNATVSHKFDEYNHLYVSGYYSKDRFKFEYYDRYEYYNKNATVRWRRIFSNELSGVFSVGWDHYDYQSSDTETPSMGYRLDFGIDQYFAKIDFTHRIDQQHQLTYGFHSTWYSLNPGRYNPYGEESLVMPDRLQKENALESALYISDKWDLTPSIALDLGVRYSIFNVLGPRDYNTYAPGHLPSEATLVETRTDQKGILKTYHGPEFRAAARFAFGNDYSVKAGINSMRQYIYKISNTTVMTPTDTWKLSDVNIKPQRGIQYAVGIYKDIKDQFIEFSVEGYYKTMKDYLDYRHNAELVMNHTLETDILNTRGRAYGVELMMRRTEGKLNGWASYTWARTELIQDDPKIVDPVNNGNWYPADFDKPHEFKLVGNYKFTHRFSLSLNCEYATGRPITLPVSKYQYAGGEFVYYTDRNAYRIPDYFRMDISFNVEPSHHLTLLTHSMFSFGVY